MSRPPAAGWHLAWRAETAFPHTSTTATSCRFVAKLTGYGSQIRAEFTSRAGSAGYSIITASVATAQSTATLALQAGTSHPLTFAGRGSAPVRAGAAVLSDPLPMTVRPGFAVAVTVTASAGDASRKAALPEPAGCAESRLANPADAPAGAFPTVARVQWLRSLLVDGPAQRSIVALGDSITEGGATGAVTYDRWSDRIADTGVLVANAGVGGNAVSRIGLFGTPPATERARAVLAEPNVTDLVTLLGTNDLGMGSSADQVLRGLDDILAQGRVRGTAVWVGTILPRVGSSWSTTAERARQQVNAALRGRWLTDRGGRLIDTDKALQNPASPTRLLPAYDSGDHLHPSAAGERAIGAAVLTRLGTTALLSSAPTAVPTPGSPAPKAPSSGATGPIAVTSPAPTGTPSTSGGILGAVVRAVRHLW